MKADRENEHNIQLGRGRLLSGDAMRALVRAVTSRGYAWDWAKGRLLTMVLTLVAIAWGVGGIIDLTSAVSPLEASMPHLVGEGMENRAEDEKKVTGGNRTNEKLRSDLFKVAERKKDNPKKEPKTNPAELLRLLELQGVLGGNHPRAIVFYKLTKETVTVSVGDGLGEFEVMEIRDRSVILKWREELFELSL